MTAMTSHPVPAIRGVIRAPGDKSCSHRALMFAAIAQGRSRLTGVLDGADVLATAAALNALGAVLEQGEAGTWTVDGRGGAAFGTPQAPLDFGNSGTGVRLMMGLLAGHPVTADLTGDESLCRRPMNRVLVPLRQMGLKDTAGPDGRLPFRITGRHGLAPLTYAPPQASAQVKSAILLAGLGADGVTRVEEARPTRDHTEKMLRGFGVEVGVAPLGGGGEAVTLAGGQRLQGIETSVPGDPSSAAFALAAAMVSPAGEVLVEGVMSNERRDGVYRAAGLMGAAIGAEETGEAAGERLVDLQAATAALKGVAIPEALVASMIDEFPILAVLAAFAAGETRITGAEELRHKESDRISAVVAMLRACGVGVEEHGDGFTVEGCGGPPPGGGRVETRHDHRIAMSALVLGTAAQAPVTVDDTAMIATSYPGFLADMAALGADIRPA